MELQIPVKTGGSWGAVIGIAIIILVLIFGGLYFWGAKLSQSDQEKGVSPAAEEETPSNTSSLPLNEKTLAAPLPQELSAIVDEAALNLSLDTVDADLESLESSLVQ